MNQVSWHKETFVNVPKLEQEWLDTHPPLPYRKRLAMARRFSKEVGEPIEDWMLSPNWYYGIGCINCVHGRHAPCWGYDGCHGFYKGCGCRQCAARSYALTVAQTFEEQSR